MSAYNATLVSSAHWRSVGGPWHWAQHPVPLLPMDLVALQPPCCGSGIGSGCPMIGQTGVMCGGRGWVVLVVPPLPRYASHRRHPLLLRARLDLPFPLLWQTVWNCKEVSKIYPMFAKPGEELPNFRTSGTSEKIPAYVLRKRRN